MLFTFFTVQSSLSNYVFNWLQFNHQPYFFPFFLSAAKKVLSFVWWPFCILELNSKCSVKNMKQMMETYSYLNGKSKHYISILSFLYIKAKLTIFVSGLFQTSPHSSIFGCSLERGIKCCSPISNEAKRLFMQLWQWQL